MEEWRTIIEYPNYDISTLGNIKNNKTNKILKQIIKSGYNHISLTNKFNRKFYNPRYLLISYLVILIWTLYFT